MLIVIPSLFERVITYFNKIYRLKKHETIFFEFSDFESLFFL